MAPYADQQDMEDHFGSDQVLLASDRNGGGEIDVGVLESALVKASDEIDSYIVQRYTLPLSTIPGVLRSHACEIAMYRMSTHQGGGLTEEKRTRYEDSVSWLTKLAKGIVSLDDDVTSGATEELKHLPVCSAETREMTRSKLSRLF